MPNIKFSDFTAEADINNFEGVVGFTTDVGGVNYKIQPLQMPARYDGGTSNIALGDSKTLLGTNIASGGDGNLAIGFETLGDLNPASGQKLGSSIAIGNGALSSITEAGTLLTGQQIAIGVNAQGSNGGSLPGILAADENVAIGYNALGSNQGDWSSGFPTDLGRFNTAIGGRSLEDLDGGTSNTALGHNSGLTLYDGAGNTLVGFEVGSNAAQSIGLFSEDGVTAMGWQAASQGDYSITIGYNAASISYIQNPAIGPPVAVPPARTIVIGSDSVSAAPNNIIIGSDSSITLGSVYTSSEDILIGHDCEIRTPAIPTFLATNNTSIGNRSTIEGSYNTHMGYFVDILGDDNTSIGYFNTIYGNNNCTLGDFSLVGTGVGPGEASHCIAVGGNTTTTAGSFGSMIIGVNTTNTIARGAFEIGFGGTDITPATNDVVLVGKNGGSLGGTSKLDLIGELNIAPRYTQFKSLVAFNYNDQGGILAPNYDLSFNDGNVVKLTLESGPGISVVGPDGTTASVKAGVYNLILEQSPTAPGGPFIPVFNPAQFKWPGGVAPVLSTGAGEIDMFTLVCDGTNFYGTFEKDFS